MNAWLALSGVAAIGISVMSAYKLVWYPEMFRWVERLGLGLMAGSAIMSIPAAVLIAPTPFDEWAAAVLRVGVFLYLGGKVVRLRKHARANAAMIEAARQRRRDRGLAE